MKGELTTTRANVFLLDTDRERYNWMREPNYHVCVNLDEIVEATLHASAITLWISCRPEMTDLMLNASHRIRPISRLGRSLGNLLMLQPPTRLSTFFPLEGYFRRVAGCQAGGILPMEELVEVIQAPKEVSRDLFIGGSVDVETGTLALIRGNLQTVTVPISMFQRTDDGITPDPTHFAISDYGHVIHLGEYEVAADSILYQIDSKYRRRVNEKRRIEDQGFGASLRRLRRAKGLGRGDFAPLSPKTIARIERGEISKPHGDTLSTLAVRLQVKADDIQTY